MGAEGEHGGACPGTRENISCTVAILRSAIVIIKPFLCDLIFMVAVKGYFFVMYRRKKNEERNNFHRRGYSPYYPLK